MGRLDPLRGGPKIGEKWSNGRSSSMRVGGNSSCASRAFWDLHWLAERRPRDPVRQPLTVRPRNSAKPRRPAGTPQRIPEIPAHSNFGIFQFWRLPGISGTIGVSRAAETTDTALRPLTRSSAVTAPRTEEHLVFCSTASRGFQSPGKSPDAFHKFKTSLESGALSHTEPVSGLRAVSAVSAAPRFARGQCYLKSLALGAPPAPLPSRNSAKNPILE